MKLKPFVHYILSRIFAKANHLIPKDERVIMFISTPDFSDNPRYLYEKAKDLLEGYTFVWVVSDKGKFQDLEDDSTVFVQYRTIEYLKWILRAKYLVLSHGVPYWKSGNQVAILLWHGIPLKAMGASLKTVKVPPWSKWILNKTDFFIIPSAFSWLLFKADVQFTPQEILYFGQPRCDALFMPSQKARENLSQILGADVTEYTKTIMYLPTFRDYDSKATSRISLELINNSKFRDFLSQNNVLFIVKPHPHDEKLFEKYESDHIKIVKNEELLSRFLTLYDILPAVDILVTDYSSVYFDYLLLNRPIVFYIPDLEKYRETRGFLLEPYEKWTPGDKARTPEELVVALEEAINNPKKWERERLWLRDVMFKYQDGKASERIIKYFWG